MSSTTTATNSAVDALIDDNLQEIFIHLAERSRPSFRDIVAVSHVCTRWRKLAIGCPELWRRFAYLTRADRTTDEDYSCGYDHQFTAEILLRCGALTLDVGWQEYEFRPVKFLERELALSDRIRSYAAEIHLGNDAWKPVEDALQFKAAPALEDLRLKGIRSSTDEMVLRIPYIFTNTLPSLTHLAMIDCYADLRTVSMPKLQQLLIEARRGSDAGNTVSIQRGALFGALASHRELKALCIKMDTSFIPLTPCEPLQMHRIVNVELAGGFETINSFFRHISTPRLLRLKICFLGPPSSRFSMGDDIRNSVEEFLSTISTSRVSADSTLSFTRYTTEEVEGVLSPRRHIQPVWVRGLYPGDLEFTFLLPEWTGFIGFVPRDVVSGFGMIKDKVKCLELPDDMSTLRNIRVFKHFILDWSTSHKAIICNKEWEQMVARAILELPKDMKPAFLSHPTRFSTPEWYTTGLMS